MRRFCAFSPPALVASIIWGLSLIYTKWAVLELPAAGVALLRFAVAAAAACALLPAAARSARHGCPWRWIVGLALISITIPHLLYTEGLRLTTAVHGGWIMGWQPAVTAALSVPILRERLTRTRLLGIAIGALGMTLVITEGHWAGLSLARGAVRGDLLVLAATTFWSLQAALGRKYAGECPPVALTAYTIILGWLFLLPWGGLGEIRHAWRNLSPRFWVSILFLGLLASLVAYWLWYKALEVCEASLVAGYLYLEPIVTSVAAALILGERMSAAAIAGGALILVGLFTAHQHPRTTAPREAAT